MLPLDQGPIQPYSYFNISPIKKAVYNAQHKINVFINFMCAGCNALCMAILHDYQPGLAMGVKEFLAACNIASIFNSMWKIYGKITSANYNLNNQKCHKDWKLTDPVEGMFANLKGYQILTLWAWIEHTCHQVLAQAKVNITRMGWCMEQLCQNYDKYPNPKEQDYQIFKQLWIEAHSMENNNSCTTSGAHYHGAYQTQQEWPPSQMMMMVYHLL